MTPNNLVGVDHRSTHYYILAVSSSHRRGFSSITDSSCENKETLPLFFFILAPHHTAN